MTREQARREIDSLDYYLQNHTDDYGEESHTAMMMAIQALQADGDLVSRQAVIDAIDKWVKNMGVLIALPVSEVTPLFDSIHKLPSVKPQEPKTGHWIAIKRGYLETPRFECSECHTQEFVETCMYKPIWNYCPNCGAKMVKPQERSEE